MKALRKKIRMFVVPLLLAPWVGAQGSSAPAFWHSVWGTPPWLEYQESIPPDRAEVDLWTKLTFLDMIFITRRSDRELLKALRDRKDPNFTPLIAAILYGANPMYVRSYINRGADVKMTTRSGLTPMVAAAANRNGAEIGRMLLARGAPLDFLDDTNGDTLLHVAVYAENPGFVKFLLEYKVPTNVKNDAGETPRDMAVREGFSEMVKILDTYNK